MRERIDVGDHIFRLWVLLLPLVFILSLRKLWGFLLYGFPEENSLCLLSLMIIVVHVSLSDNILGLKKYQGTKLSQEKYKILMYPM